MPKAWFARIVIRRFYQPIASDNGIVEIPDSYERVGVLYILLRIGAIVFGFPTTTDKVSYTLIIAVSGYHRRHFLTSVKKRV